MEKCLSKVVTVRSFAVGEVGERQELKDKKVLHWEGSFSNSILSSVLLKFVDRALGTCFRM